MTYHIWCVCILFYNLAQKNKMFQRYKDRYFCHSVCTSAAILLFSSTLILQPYQNICEKNVYFFAFTSQHAMETFYKLTNSQFEARKE
jgi:hypothetical protein